VYLERKCMFECTRVVFFQITHTHTSSDLSVSLWSCRVHPGAGVRPQPGRGRLPGAHPQLHDALLPAGHRSDAARHGPGPGGCQSPSPPPPPPHRHRHHHLLLLLILLLVVLLLLEARRQGPAGAPAARGVARRGAQRLRLGDVLTRPRPPLRVAAIRRCP